MSYTGQYASNCPNMKILHLGGTKWTFFIQLSENEHFVSYSLHWNIFILLSRKEHFLLSEVKNVK